jgi:hypothetical protein
LGWFGFGGSRFLHRGPFLFSVFFHNPYLCCQRQPHRPLGRLAHHALDLGSAVVHALNYNFIMYVQHHVIQPAQRMAQYVISNGLGYILNGKAAPQTGARPLGRIGGGLPRRFEIGYSIAVEFGVGIAQHPA